MEEQFKKSEKQLFMECYEKYYHEKPNKRPWNIQYLNEVATDILAAKNGAKKKRRDYYLLQTYDVITVNDKHLVIKKIEKQNHGFQYIVPEEEIFDKLSDVHISCGHGSRDKMLSIIQQNSVIPRPCVEMFLRACQACTKKNKFVAKVINPIPSNHFMARGHVDLIDLQSHPDGDFNWIMNYQDLATKFICLRPLHSKHVTEVAEQLLKIFLQFGAPVVLQSSTDREFISEVIAKLKRNWPQLCTIQGRLYYPNMNSVEHSCVEELENMLHEWMTDNNSTNWSLGCYFVQWQKNNSRHKLIGCNPYKAVFGSDVKLGLKSTHTPHCIMPTKITKEDAFNRMETETYEDDTLILRVPKEEIDSPENMEENSTSMDLVEGLSSDIENIHYNKYDFNQDIKFFKEEIVEDHRSCNLIICGVCQMESYDVIFCEICNTSAHARCLDEENLCNLCAT